MKTHAVIWKKQSFNNVLRGLFWVMLLGAMAACSDPVSIDDEALAAETTAALNRAEGGDKAAGATDPASDEGDQDDPNAPVLGGEGDEGHDDDGSLDGDYADINRPGQVVICHVPAGGADAPRSLSLLPDAVADHTAHPDDYDGPCSEEDKEDGANTGDQGSDDHDDPNAQPVGGDNDDGGDTSNLNDGRGSAGQ
jgi:hypothetical protein